MLVIHGGMGRRPVFYADGLYSFSPLELAHLVVNIFQRTFSRDVLAKYVRRGLRMGGGRKVGVVSSSVTFHLFRPRAVSLFP